MKFRAVRGAQALALGSQDADILSSELVGGTGVVRLKSRSRTVAALVQAYGSRPDVAYAEPNYVWHARDFPNDEFAGRQWALRNTGQTIEGIAGTPGADIRAAAAWDITEGSRSIVTGVVDSGIDYTHPDLAANVWSAPAAFSVTIGGQLINCAAGTHGFNAITRTCDPRDDVGHGTHVAGVLGATGNNGAGVSGVSRIASIMGLKFLGPDGGKTSDVLAALDFAMQVKAIFPTAANIRILNNSWGGSVFSQALLDEINLTAAQDMLFVVAAGNVTGGQNNDLTPEYPTNFAVPNIVSVAATDARDQLASYSSWGPSTVHLGAPGTNIFSTLSLVPYGFQSGTSMAAPMVSGAAALVLAACPMSTSALKTSLLNSVDAVASLANRTVSGGRLNVFRALTSCAGSPGANFGLSIVPGKAQLDLNQPADFSVAVTGANGFAGPVNLAVQGLPGGMTGTLSATSISGGSGSSTLTLTASPAVEAGTYAIGVVATSGGIQRLAGVSVTVGFSITSGQTISGQLTATDPPSAGTGQYSDLYKLSLNAATPVTIDVKSRVFDPLVYLRSSAGEVLFSDDDNGLDNNSRIQTTLAAGTYSIEVTSRLESAIGLYTLSINTPTLTSVTPGFAGPGSTVNVTLNGERFVAPMTISAGSGITVSSVNVVNPSTATAVFAIETAAALTPRDLTVQTSEGTSNALKFTVPRSIAVGQRISADLSVTDQTLINTNSVPYRYADIYELIVPAMTSITLEMTSSTFGPFLRVSLPSGAVVFQAPSTLVLTLAAGTYFIDATSNSSLAIGAYSLGINVPSVSSIIPAFVAPGATTNVQLAGTRFANPMTVDAGMDITATNVNAANETTANATLGVAANAQIGRRNLTVTTPAGVSNDVPINVVPITTLGIGTTNGTLSANDVPSVASPGGRADLYRLTTPGFGPGISQNFSIAVQSTLFNPTLLLLNSSGALLASAVDQNDGYASISGNLAYSTVYLVEVTAVDDGASGSYSLTRNGTVIRQITPTYGERASWVDVTFTGQFLALPNLIDAGPDISISNVTLTSQPGIQRLMARFNIAPNASVGTRTIRITTSVGTQEFQFTVLHAPLSAAIGQTISGTLSATDQPSMLDSGSYADRYTLTVPGPAYGVVELRSTAFSPSLNVFDSTGVPLSHAEGSSLARIGSLNPGFYIIEASSVSPAVGNYTLSFPPQVVPTITSISPDIGGRGTTFGVVVTGTNFSSPMNLAFSSGEIVANNVRVHSPTMATAIVTVRPVPVVHPSLSPVINVSATVSAVGEGGPGPAVPFSVVASVPSATPASILRFPRLLSASDLGVTGVAVVNPSSAPADVTFSRYSDAGVLQGYYVETIGARSQLSRLGSELFPDAGVAGWIKVTSPTAGLQGFWVSGDFTTVMDGAEGAPFGRTLLLPLVTSTAELNVVSVGASVSSLSMQLFDGAGTALATNANVTVPLNGGYKNTINNLFPGVNLVDARYLRVTGTEDIAATILVPNFPVTPSFVVLNGIDTSVVTTEMNFAHVPTGGTPAWSSIVGVTNLSTSSQTVTLTFNPTTGSPTTVTRSLGSVASLRESAETLFGFPATTYREGWVKVSGTAALAGFIAYGFSETGGAAAVPVQAVPRSTMIFSHVATGPAWSTGLALLNTSSTDASVEVYIMRKTGALVGGAANVPTAAFTLPAGSKRAALLTEFVPASTADDGFVYVRTTNNVPLYGFELFFSRDLKVIANVPAGILAPGITFTPPTN